MLPLISIVIINYNREDYLGETIASILNQTWQNLELLVWDDGSTDNSVDIAYKYAQKDSRVRIIAATHQGIAKSRQNAIAQTTGIYFVYVNSNQILPPTALAETAAILNSKPASANRLILKRKQPWRHFFNTNTKKIKALCWRLTPYIIPLIGVMSTGLANAQIVPDNTLGTNVTTNGNTININGGTTSGANLFHSFQQFGLSQTQIANFLANPNIDNILSRITGGDPSIINGLIQVTGSNANLYLMNPAGFVFGSNASLNVPSAFTATTANGISFGDNWFNNFGSNDYSLLVGNPSGFGFSMSQQGTIINAGNLAVGTGQSLNLLGGTVVNTGTVSAPQGQISITSVDGQKWVRLSQPGNLLSLEIQAFSGQNQPNSPVLSISSLPELLTVGNTGLTANPDGTVQITNSNIKLPSTPGTTILSGTVDVTGNTGGKVNILGNQIGVINANITASGNFGGGEVLIGGDFQGNGTVPNATQTYIDANSLISADSTVTGNGGKVIIWSDNLTKFFGNITARGGTNSGDGGFVEVSGKNSLTFNGQVDTSAVNGNKGTLLLDPSTLTIIDAPLNTGTFDTSFSGNIAAGDPDNGANTISWGALANLGVGANIDLQATGNITINAITGATPGVTTPGLAILDLGTSGSFNLTSTNGAVNFVNLTNEIRTTGGSISITGTSLNLGNLATNANLADSDSTFSGNLTLSATGNINAGNIATLAQGFATQAGNIQINSTNGNISLGNLNSSVSQLNFLASNNNAMGGNINLSAPGFINVGTINTSVADALTGAVASGIVNITSTADSITTNNINSSVTRIGGGGFTGAAGVVSLNAMDNITVNGAINTSATALEINGIANILAGNVSLSTTNSFGSTIRFININTQATTDSSSNTVQGGNVEVLTNGLIQGTGIIAGSGNTIATGGIVTSNFEEGSTTEAIIGAGGTIQLQHDGGFNNNDFIVGNPIINGTLASISRGDEIISTSNFPVLPNGGNATGTPTGITITSVNTPPTITTDSPIPSITQPNESVNFIFNPSTTDDNGDIRTVEIDSILTGTLRRGPAVLAAGDPLIPGEILNYTPPTDSTGSINAFTVRSSDRISFSEPATVAIDINTTPDLPDLPDLPEPPCIGSTCKVVRPPKPPIPILPILPPNPQDNPLIDGNPIPEDKFTANFVSQLGISAPKVTNLNEAKNIALNIETATGIKPAFIYLSFVPVEVAPSSISNKQLKTISEQNTDELEIILVTATGNPIRKRIPNVTKAEVLKVAREFRNRIVAPQYRRRKSYLNPAQKLYSWIIEPIEADLQTQDIKNLVFLPDIGLRSTPLAALHDGKQFLIEKYSVGLMPSLSLTNTLYTDIKQSQVLAMGVAQSTQGQEPLPAVPLELRTLVNKLWSGKLLLDKQATLQNLKSIRRYQPFGIIHLATHADFARGALNNSYIQLWEDKLRLNQIRQLGFNNPQVEMLVLSACRSALGNEEAEIGFAGLAVLAGVKTSVASLWAVDDGGTAALMTKFYEQLKTAPIRAEALRKAQVAMATGQISLKNGRLEGLEQVGNLPLPTGSFRQTNQSLSHPYYWAAFTMVGNPW